MGSLEKTFIMNMLLCVLFVIFSSTSVCCKDDVEREGDEIFTSGDLGYDDTYDEDSDEEIEEDFEYFYNLEMMKELDILDNDNKTKAYVEDAYEEYGVEANYYEDSTELDLVLDDLLNEDLIDESLDDFDYELPKSNVTRKEMREESRNMLNLILLISFLVASISILLISLTWTANNCYRKVKTEEENAVKAEEPSENILLRSGSKILWKGRSKRNVARHEQWI